jgi:phospholipid/cholesterol/gamma-HCH transport system substrate-binding protein
MSTKEPSSPPNLRSRDYDREVRVGLFVIAGIAIVLFSLFTFTDAAMFRGRYVVTTLVKDAGGIRRGDPVQMRGVNIGRVQKFGMVPEGVTLHLEIEGEYSIPRDSRVEIKLGSLLGGMVAGVIPGASETSVRGGDQIPGTTGSDLTTAANQLADRTQAAIGRVQALLSAKTVRNIEDSSEELAQLLKDLRKLSRDEKSELENLMASLRRSADGLEKTTSRPEVEAALKRLDSISSRLDDATEHLQRASRSTETVLARIERGEGTIGRMTTDSSLFDNVNKAAVSLNQAATELTHLTEDIRRQPKRYLKLSLF